MKTLKLAIIAVFISVALANVASADGFKGQPNSVPPPKIVKMTYLQALQIPELVSEMYRQLNSDFLNKNQPLYTVTVVYHDYLVKITGTYNQWSMFFGVNLKDIGVKKVDVINAQ